MEVRELLTQFEYSGNEAPIIKGSALKALNGEDSPLAGPAIEQLLNSLDAYFPTPTRGLDKPFLMPIESSIVIPGRGTVATGAVEQGVIKLGDEVEITGLINEPPIKCTVTGLEMFRKVLDRGEAGDTLGVLLRANKDLNLKRGQILCAPGSVKCLKSFDCQVYILTKEEGGRHTSFQTNYAPQFFFRTANITGKVTLPKEVSVVMPGDNVALHVDLLQPTPVNVGMKFSIREGGKTIGAGVVNKVYETTDDKKKGDKKGGGKAPPGDKGKAPPVPKGAPKKK